MRLDTRYYAETITDDWTALLSSTPSTSYVSYTSKARSSNGNMGNIILEIHNS